MQSDTLADDCPLWKLLIIYADGSSFSMFSLIRLFPRFLGLIDGLLLSALLLDLGLLLFEGTFDDSCFEKRFESKTLTGDMPASYWVSLQSSPAWLDL